ncbi:MAG: ATP-grasp domain-containing protein [Hyphomonadaceae bacterium]|nr:ATP-grasp domain-containing protein [Hyphomonadaceae bacterium]
MTLSKLLIANRGEIACRIMATCRALGIETVAVYSDADAFAKHVREADEAVHIGAASAAESYLNVDRLLSAAKITGADAVHPGYGFLSENAEFAEAVQAAGLIWVGPKPETIRAMGLKDEAKRIAEEAGVPVLPGYRGAAQDAAMLETEADKIGYPLLIKAVAGGGGRGIRLVTGKKALAAELESAVREAEAAFGDGRVMLEKLVERPRHIEVQVFGDAHGNAVHMFERDCSLQRRRQKVVEEAPAPGMPEEVRAAMTEASVALAKAVGYEGAGTVEFIVDGAQPLSLETFWFLEMNTRLQVEHPVSEMITGLDFVELQLRIAAGEPLGLSQDEIEMHGHAIEARICAEDPAEGFRPGAGRIEAFGPLEAPDGETLRWEAGFEAGDQVPPTYDSMIAKLVVWDETRDEAIDRLAGILSHTQLVGVPGNVGFLGRCVVSQEFGEGEHHVNWIAEAGEALTAVPAENRLAAMSAVADILLQETGEADPWALKDGWRLNSPPRAAVRLDVNGVVEAVDLDADLPEDAPLPLVTDLSAERFAVTAAGDSFLIEVPTYQADAEAAAGGDAVLAPMPGKLIALNAEAGASVVKDDVLAVMEAMKMEHALVAPRDGVVEAVSAVVGDQVAEGDVLVALVAE